jgi:hypothetical protein
MFVQKKEDSYICPELRRYVQYLSRKRKIGTVFVQKNEDMYYICSEQGR